MEGAPLDPFSANSLSRHPMECCRLGQGMSGTGQRSEGRALDREHAPKLWCGRGDDGEEFCHHGHVGKSLDLVARRMPGFPASWAHKDEDLRCGVRFVHDCSPAPHTRRHVEE